MSPLAELWHAAHTRNAEGAGELGEGVRKKPRSDQVLTSRRSLFLHAVDKERKSQNS